MQSLKKCANLSCRVSKNVQPLVQSLKKCANLSSRVSKNVLTFRAESQKMCLPFVQSLWLVTDLVVCAWPAFYQLQYLSPTWPPASPHRGVWATQGPMAFGSYPFLLLLLPPPPHLLLVCRDIGGLGGYIIHMMEKYSLYHYRTSYLLHVFGRIKSSETKFKTAY